MIQVKRSMLYISAGSVLLLFALTLLVALPLQRSLVERSDELYQARIAEQSAIEEVRNLAVAREEYRRLQSTSDQLASYFVSEGSVLQFLSAIDAIATEHRVHSSVQSLDAPKDGTKTSTLALSATGTFPDLLAFVDDLERIDTYLVLTDVRFEAVNDPGAPIILTAQGTLPWR